MRKIAASTSYTLPFGTTETPDALPIATIYADETSLGSATVTTAPGTNAYRVTISLPGNIAEGAIVTVTIDWATGGTSRTTATLLLGEVWPRSATAAQATAIANDAAAAKAASEAAESLLDALTELDGEQLRLTAAALATVLDAIAASEGADTAQIAADVLAGLSTVSITRIGPEFDPATSTITLIAGDDYLVDNSNAITFAVSLPGIDLTGATAVFSAEKSYQPVLMGTADLIDAGTAEPKLRLQWTRAQTNVTPSDKYAWGVAIVTAAGHVQTIIRGPLVLKPHAVAPSVVDAAI